jgi:hypothetical protein
LSVISGLNLSLLILLSYFICINLICLNVQTVFDELWDVKLPDISVGKTVSENLVPKST